MAQKPRPKPSPGEPAPAMQVFNGLGVSSGIVIGRAMVLDDDFRHVQRRTVSEAGIKGELARLDKAIKAAVDELTAAQKAAKQQMGDEAVEIFRVHVAMLTDKYTTGPARRLIEKDRVGAEYAVARTMSDHAEQLRNSGNSAIATKANDVEDLQNRLLNHLLGPRASRLDKAPDNSVVIARDLTPSQAAGFNRKRILGFATDLGGRTSHTAIVARALGLPAVVGCQILTESIPEGAPVILDGEQGILIVHPDKEHLEQYRLYTERRRLFQLELSEIADLPSVTADGTPIEVLGNIEFADEVNQVLDNGGSGVGLYRTEFLYLTSNHEPTEGEHYQSYKRCVELCAGRTLTIRTVDLGADKYTQARAEIPERNPFLGLRSIRYCLKSQPMFKRQLRAILRASALGPIKVMFPLITSVSEFRSAKYLLNDAMEDLDEQGLPFDRDLKIGMMVEVPSAALMADVFAREVDFFSIGTNDLVQYTLAVDRTNERVANLYNPGHPAVIQLIRTIIRAARRHEIPVSCCGESASDPEYALLLMGLGLRTLSVTSSSIPALKRMIRSVTIPQCERIARQALTFDSDVQVSSYLRDRARQIVPEAFDGRSAD